MRKMRVTAVCVAVCIAGLFWGTKQSTDETPDEIAALIQQNQHVEPSAPKRRCGREAPDLILLECVVATEVRRLDIERSFEEVRNDILRFIQFVKLIESNGDPHAKAATSSAMSLFQFTVPSVPTAVSRLENYMARNNFGTLPEWAAKLRDEPQLLYKVRELRQAILTIVNIVEQRGSDALLLEFLNGERESAKALYYAHHHTDPDNATFRRTEHIFSKIFN